MLRFMYAKRLPMRLSFLVVKVFDQGLPRAPCSDDAARHEAAQHALHGLPSILDLVHRVHPLIVHHRQASLIHSGCGTLQHCALPLAVLDRIDPRIQSCVHGAVLDLHEAPLHNQFLPTSFLHHVGPRGPCGIYFRVQNPLEYALDQGFCVFPLLHKVLPALPGSDQFHVSHPPSCLFQQRSILQLFFDHLLPPRHHTRHRALGPPCHGAL